MKRLLLLLPLLLFATISQSSVCTILSVGVDTGLSWLDPTEREDNTKLSKAEIANYILNVTNKTQNTKCTVELGRVNDYKLITNPKEIYDVAIVTRDTNGRLSIPSKSVPINIDLKKPAYPEVIVTQLNGTNSYSIGWPEVTKFADGSPLLAPPIKYYLFINGKWLQEPNSDIYANQLPVTRVLAMGDTIAVETEIELDGVTIAGDRSPIITIAEVIVPVFPPKPTVLEYTIPRGYEKITIIVD